MISSVFIHRPRLAIVISIVISIAGVIALARASGRAVPRHRAAAGAGQHHLSRRLGRRGRRERRAGHRRPGQRRRPNDLHEVDLRRRRQLRPQCDLRRSAATPTSIPSMSPTGSTRRWRNCRPRSSATASRPRSSRPRYCRSSRSTRRRAPATRCSCRITPRSTSSTP